ncbi:MAG: hypothetical protein QOI73_1611 [Solirubrobacteraceae bacterium]|jgi:hypothetical protein|nr:hypothetical protein [Solirubrobacteraceae bacterium]
MSAYPVVYSQIPAVDRSRLTVFFRIIMVIPHLIMSLFYGIAAGVVVFLAWFAIVVTGRYPAGMYEFVAGYLRYSARLNAYMYLVTDEYPPFDGAEHPEFPVILRIPGPKESYSRLTTFFRIILMIPIAILLYVFNLWIQAVALAIWLVAVIMGKTSAGLVDAERFPLAYLARAGAYGCLLTDQWPPLED